MTAANPRRKARIIPDSTSDAELAADEIVEQAIGERLPRIRAAATAWGASVSTITALFGTGVVIDADEQVRALRPGHAVVYGVLAALALSAAAASIYLAARAAESRPQPMPADVRKRAAAIDTLFETAVSALRWSRVCAALAVLLLVASLGVRWYGPRAVAPTTAPLSSASVLAGERPSPTRGALRNHIPSGSRTAGKCGARLASAQPGFQQRPVWSVVEIGQRVIQDPDPLRIADHMDECLRSNGRPTTSRFTLPLHSMLDPTDLGRVPDV